MTKRYRIRVVGKVQGVWYRQSTVEQALKNKLTGFVKNQPDGSVYIEACGDESRLKAFLNWCKKGPENADVLQVQVEEADLGKRNETFEITG